MKTASTLFAIALIICQADVCFSDHVQAPQPPSLSSTINPAAIELAVSNAARKKANSIKTEGGSDNTSPSIAINYNTSNAAFGVEMISIINSLTVYNEKQTQRALSHFDVNGEHTKWLRVCPKERY